MNVSPEHTTERHVRAAADRAWTWYFQYENHDNLECAGAQVAYSQAQRWSDKARDYARVCGLPEPNLPCP